MRDLRTLLFVVASFTMLAFLPGFAGCDKALIDGVTFSVEPNIETVKVQLNFSRDVQSDLGGAFDVNVDGRDYGNLEVEPSTPDNPFNVGFRLNLAIVNEQKYVSLDPVRDLPSGQPIPIPGLDRAFARVKMKNEINPNFDIYAYVDVANNGKEWVGLAMTLKFINNKYFPAGLSFSKGFVKDKQGRNQIYGAVFGPKVDNNGNMQTPGGIALFANLKTLIAGGRAGALGGRDTGDKFYLIQGPQASYYNEHPDAAIALGEAFKELLNANSNGQVLQ